MKSCRRTWAPSASSRRRLRRIPLPVYEWGDEDDHPVLLTVPVLAVPGLVPETPNMGSTLDDVVRCLPPHARLDGFPDSGHFAHIEHSGRVVAFIAGMLSRT